MSLGLLKIQSVIFLIAKLNTEVLLNAYQILKDQSQRFICMNNVM